MQRWEINAANANGRARARRGVASPMARGDKRESRWSRGNQPRHASQRWGMRRGSDAGDELFNSDLRQAAWEAEAHRPEDGTTYQMMNRGRATEVQQAFTVPTGLPARSKLT